MYHHDAVLTNCVGNLAEVFRAFVVKPRSGCLQDETALLEVFWVRSFPQLVCSKTVTIRRKGLYYMLKCVWSVEPFFSIEVVFDILNLGVDGLGDEEVGASIEIFEETLALVNSVVPAKTARESLGS